MTELLLETKDALSVVIVHGPAADDKLIEQITLGLEEEGIPAFPVVARGASLELANHGAAASTLGVGIGVDDLGSLALTHFRMPADIPVFQIPATTAGVRARTLGINAARLVKGDPFELWDGEQPPVKEPEPPSWESLTRAELPGANDTLIKEVTAAVLKTLAAS